MKRLADASDDEVVSTVDVSRRGSGGLGDPEVLSPRLRRRRAFTLVLMTLVLPGSAQLVAGRRGLGRVALRIWAALLGAGILVGLLFLVSRSAVFGLFGRSWFLTIVQWGLFGVAALWAVLFLDAWRLGRPSGLVITTRRWLTGLTAVLMLLSPGSLVYAANTVGAGRDALDALFQGKHAVEPTAGRFNVLLLGGDSGKDRVGTRPDSIQLVSVDAQTGRAVTFGFSRDTENINFRPGSVMHRLMPEGWNCGDECLLNGLYTWAEDHKAQFPAGTTNPGVLATEEAVEALSGLDVHYYVLVDLLGFRGMVDALGGLDITVQKRTPIGGGTSRISGWIEPGRQHLNGYQALWYSRSRQGSTNYERMARQRCVMTAMVQQVNPRSVVMRFQDIAAASAGVLQTDLPQSELGYFADLALKTRSQKIKSVNFVPPLIKPWDYDPRVITSTVGKTIAASEGASATTAAAKPPVTTTRAPRARTSPATPGSSRAAAAAQPSTALVADTADLGQVCSAG
jgi:LCP family protein required for cell wall assembly